MIELPPGSIEMVKVCSGFFISAFKAQSERTVGQEFFDAGIYARMMLRMLRIREHGDWFMSSDEHEKRQTAIQHLQQRRVRLQKEKAEIEYELRVVEEQIAELEAENKSEPEK